MRIFTRVAFGFCALALMGACNTAPGREEVLPHPSASVTPTDDCTPGEPLKVKGSLEPIPSRCPTSKPREVGYSEKMDLGSFWADPPCNELPDFAGSWWRSVPPYPEDMRKAGHELFTGTMTLLTEDEARFIAPQVKMLMRHRTMLIPPKGRFVVGFERLEGPAHVGGCD